MKLKELRSEGLAVSNDCELAEPLWAVVSFDEIEAVGMTYDQAVQLVCKLEADGISGLCIITDKAASRIQN